MRQIPLWNREGEIVAYAQVDDVDYPRLCTTSWTRDRKGYAVGKRGGKHVKMHRLVLGLTDPQIQADHIDRDRLNNTRSNLRPATNAQNRQNTNGWGATGVRGVTWDKNRQKYIAGVKINYKRHNLGRFDTLEEAAAVVAAFRAEHMPFSEEALSE